MSEVGTYSPQLYSIRLRASIIKHKLTTYVLEVGLVYQPTWYFVPPKVFLKLLLATLEIHDQIHTQGTRFLYRTHYHHQEELRLPLRLASSISWLVFYIYLGLEVIAGELT